MIRDYPWLIEENASYSDDLYRWVKEHLTTEFRARSICGKDSWSQFFFKHRSDAMVFKLTWSGKVDDAMWKNRG